MKKMSQLFFLSLMLIGSTSLELVRADMITSSNELVTNESLSTIENSFNSNSDYTRDSKQTSASNISEVQNTTNQMNDLDLSESVSTTTQEETELTKETVLSEEKNTAEINAIDSFKSVSVISGIEGDGKKDTPFQINKFDEIQSVATLVSSSTYYNSINTGTVYIKLMNDIITTGRGANFSNNTNSIVINGSTTSTSGTNGRFSIYYTGGTTTSGGIFGLGSRDMNMTFTNINFGSKESPKSTYYGICYSTSANNIINVNNVNYYAETGGQPFFITGNNSTLNFLGDNTFVVSSNGPQNQEFAEFSGNMNFKANTKTAIVHKTGESLAFIWAYSTMQINVEENAQVFIQSGKTDLFYPSTAANLTVSKQAAFTYLFDNNLSYIDPNTVFLGKDDYQTIEVSGTSNASSNNFFNGNANFNIEVQNDASLNFITASSPFQTGKLSINTVDPKEIIFKHTDPNKFAINDGVYTPSLNISNNTKSNSIYNFQKNGLGTSSTKINELVLPNKGIKPMTGGYATYNSLVYQPAVKVGGISATGSSAPDISKIDSHLTGISSTLDNSFTYQAQYYISNNTDTLDQETITSKYIDGTRTPANSSTHNDGSVYTPLMSLPIESTVEGDQSTVATVDQLLSGTYIVYGRLAIVSSSGTYYTTWQNTTTTIDAVSSLVFPTKINMNDSFTYQRINGILDLKFQQSPLYTILSGSNQIMYVKPTAINEGLKNQVTLVSGIPGSGNNQKLQLKLVSNTMPLTWNLGDLNEIGTLELQPYWDTLNNKKQFYLDGSFSGPIVTSAKFAVEYNLIFSMSPK